MIARLYQITDTTKRGDLIDIAPAGSNPHVRVFHSVYRGVVVHTYHEPQYFSGPKFGADTATGLPSLVQTKNWIDAQFN